MHRQDRRPDPTAVVLAVVGAERRAAVLLERAARVQQAALQALACSTARLAARREQELVDRSAGKGQAVERTGDAHDADPTAFDQQAEIDAEVSASARALRDSGDEQEAGLRRRERDADERDVAADRRDEQAAQHQVALEDQQWAADERDRLLSRREQQLDERERVADQQEIDRELAGWNDTK